MQKSWAISGVDLHLDVPRRHVRAGLEQALREAVSSGRLPAGTRLPASRQLAADLGLARNTVAEAYGQLVAEGWLEARQGSGTRVAAGAPTRAAAAAPAQEIDGLPYSLRSGSPDLTAFPRAAWVRALRDALAVTPAEALGYTDPRGRPELREALATYLARARGVRTSPDRIVVCSGFTQGLALVADVLCSRGATRVATEAFGLPPHRAALRHAGLRTTSLPVDHQGADVSALRGEDAVLLTPAHQFPLGAALSPARRTAVAAWAHDTGGLVVEDDYDGEFRYDRQPVGALQALAPEHVVHAGTASKSVAPGLRLGWLVLPTHLVDEVVAAKAAADGQSGVLDQLTLARLIDDGGYDRHVRRQRLSYRRRRDALVAALAPTDARVTGVAAGLHALVTLPEGRTEDEVVARAADLGLDVEPLAPYRNGRQHHPPALVVGYATPPAHAFDASVRQLVRAIAESG